MMMMRDAKLDGSKCLFMAHFYRRFQTGDADFDYLMERGVNNDYEVYGYFDIRPPTEVDPDPDTPKPRDDLPFNARNQNTIYFEMGSSPLELAAPTGASALTSTSIAMMGLYYLLA